MTQARESDEGEVVVAGVTRIEEKDLVRAYSRVPRLRGPRRRALFGLSAFMVIPGSSVMVGLTAGSVPSLVFGLVFGAAVASIAWKVWRAPVNAWRARPEWERQLRFELTKRVLRLRTEHTSDEMSWSLCTGWTEAEDAFYVEVARGPTMVHILPKSAFEGREVPLVRAVLEQHVIDRPAGGKRGCGRWLAMTFLLWLALVGGVVLIAVLRS